MPLSIVIPDADFATSIGTVAIPHRYWRLSWASTGDPGFFAIADIELRTTPGGADQTTPSTSVTSIGANDAVPVGHAFDNDGETIWNSGAPAFPVSATIDFGAGNEKVVSEIQITPWSAAPYRAPAQMTVLTSDNGVDFTEAWSVASISGWTTAAKVFTRP